MDIFINQLFVGGCAVTGHIKDGKFYMTDLNPSNKLKPPLSREIEFDKDWIEVTIEELRAIREKL
jgi:hypothetical protein